MPTTPAEPTTSAAHRAPSTTAPTARAAEATPRAHAPLSAASASNPTEAPVAPRTAWAHAIGLHPFVAFGMVAVDMMLFGQEAATAGIALAVTVPIALALTVPCVLLQRYAYGDNWGAALGKGLMVGVLTAIPLPIGSPFTIVAAIVGLRRPKALPAPR